ncbi:hypothetical protein AB0758_49320 [Tolypothrix bouteillei VB521301_2]|uniref:Uncharacterized protein n=1 Tax=Tolypothrix bouteillei VB521301 TaxID=1479485 RepID=A0A0C1REL4_9CYAN
MAETNPFERMLENRGDVLPGSLRDSFIYVHDTLESCKTVAESIFGKGNYTASDVLQIYQFVRDRKEQLSVED